MIHWEIYHNLFPIVLDFLFPFEPCGTKCLLSICLPLLSMHLPLLWRPAGHHGGYGRVSCAAAVRLPAVSKMTNGQTQLLSERRPALWSF
jgi:hypothetical protein